MKIELPKYVMDCINALKGNGYEAFCVGGAVRDLLLGILPFDYDITTSAPPEKVIELFPKNIPTGLKHGTVTVVTDCGNIEVTTYRVDGEYLDSRHPDNVSFTDNIEGDLSRRDFTINAIAFDGEKFVSVAEAFNDLEKGIIRAVGDPKKRFIEDALRILRCFRFSAQLRFNIEKKTLDAALKNNSALEFVSAERIAEELKKALLSDAPSNANPLFASGMLEFAGIKSGELPQWFNKLPKTIGIRFAAAFYALKCDPAEVSSRLKLSNKLSQEISFAHDILCKPFLISRSAVKKLLGSIDATYLKEIFLARGVILGENAEQLCSLVDDIINSGEPYTLKMLAIGGNDLKALGFSGTEIGNQLERLLYMVIDDPDLNKKEILSDISAK